VHKLQFITQAFQHPDVFNVVLLVGLGLVCLAGVYVASRTDVTVLLVAALMLEMFSGNWGLMGIPIPLDRVAMAVALGALVLKGARNVGARRLVLRPLHLALLSALAWCAISGIIAGTITTSLGFYAFLDRFGLFPFLLFCLAPIFFGTKRQRNILLAALVGMGIYLGLTGCLEGIHLYKLLLPRYIANPNVGIHWGRARGPFLEATGDGFCIFVGMVAAAIGLRTWQSTRARFLCFLAIGADLGAVFFSLTRSVWGGAALGIVGTMLLTKKTRLLLIPLLVAGSIVVGGTLVASPTIRAEAFGRAESQAPVWDRQNTDLAALRIIKEKPIFGVGWENFMNVSPNYMLQQPDYPITGLDIEVHNVFLSHAAELGIPGLLLWLAGFFGALRWAFLPALKTALSKRDNPGKDPPDSETKLWLAGGVAIVLCYFVIANSAPFSEPLPNALLWIWLGILAAPYTSVVRVRARHRAGLRLDEPLTALEETPVAIGPDLRPVYL
jgi:putative inorganic carbon (hco3(-)) transporter